MADGKNNERVVRTVPWQFHRNLNLEVRVQSVGVVPKNNDERTIGMCSNATRPRRTTRESVNSAQRFQRGGINAFYPTCLNGTLAAHTVAVQKHFAEVAANHHRGAVRIARDNLRIGSRNSSECARSNLLAQWSRIFCWPSTWPVTGTWRHFTH